MAARTYDIKNDVPLEFLVTRQITAVLEHRFAKREEIAWEAWGRVFPPETSAPGHLESIEHCNPTSGEADGVNFWCIALRNYFITVADSEPMLPTNLTKLLINNIPSRTSRNATVDRSRQARPPAWFPSWATALAAAMRTGQSPRRSISARGASQEIDTVSADSASAVKRLRPSISQNA